MPPKGHTVQIALKGELDEKAVQKLYDAIEKTPPVKTTGDIELMLHFVVVP